MVCLKPADGAGNPPDESGIKTHYLWKRILTKTGLTDIIENYAQIVEEKDDKGRKKRKKSFRVITSLTWCISS